MYCKTAVNSPWKWNVLQALHSVSLRLDCKFQHGELLQNQFDKPPFCLECVYQHSQSYENYLEFHLQRQRFSKNYINHWVLLFSNHPLICLKTCYLPKIWNRENLLGRHAVLLGRSNAKPLDRPMKVGQNLKMSETTSHGVHIHNGTVSKWCGGSFYWKGMSDISYKSFAEKVGPNNDLNIRHHILNKNWRWNCHALP